MSHAVKGKWRKERKKNLMLSINSKNPLGEDGACEKDGRQDEVDGPVDGRAPEEEEEVGVGGLDEADDGDGDRDQALDRPRDLQQTQIRPIVLHVTALYEWKGREGGRKGGRLETAGGGHGGCEVEEQAGEDGDEEDIPWPFFVDALGKGHELTGEDA